MEKERMFCFLGYKKIELLNLEHLSELRQKDYLFLKSKKWHRIPKHIKKGVLPSYHPYWRIEGRKERRNYYFMQLNNYNKCIEDPNLIRYLFNASENIISIKKKITELRISVYGS